MVKARKNTESEYPRGGEREESLEDYYERLQRVQRNEVIPTWRAEPEDRNAEPEAFNFETGYGPKETNWGGQSSPSENFKEGQDCNPNDQHKSEPGNVPSHSRNFGRSFSGSKKAP
jgi:hypothetical protein